MNRTPVAQNTCEPPLVTVLLNIDVAVTVVVPGFVIVCSNMLDTRSLAASISAFNEPFHSRTYTSCFISECKSSCWKQKTQLSGFIPPTVCTLSSKIRIGVIIGIAYNLANFEYRNILKVFLLYYLFYAILPTYFCIIIEPAYNSRAVFPFALFLSLHHTLLIRSCLLKLQVAWYVTPCRLANRFNVSNSSSALWNVSRYLQTDRDYIPESLKF